MAVSYTHLDVYKRQVETCLLAGGPEGGIVLDPFMGSGTTGMVAAQMGRHFVGIELNLSLIHI